MRANPIQVPDPASRLKVEPDQPFFGQRREELDREEWIPGSLLVHELRQGACVFPRAMQRIGDELRQCRQVREAGARSPRPALPLCESP